MQHRKLLLEARRDKFLQKHTQKQADSTHLQVQSVIYPTRKILNGSTIKSWYLSLSGDQEIMKIERPEKLDIARKITKAHLLTTPTGNMNGKNFSPY